MVKKSKKMIVPQKTFETNEIFQVFIDEEKKWMYNRIYESISLAFNVGNDTAYVMEAKIEDTMSLITINSEKIEWEQNLSLALKWYESQEMYERCAEIRDLIKNIHDSEL